MNARQVEKRRGEQPLPGKKTAKSRRPGGEQCSGISPARLAGVLLFITLSGCGRYGDLLEQWEHPPPSPFAEADRARPSPAAAPPLPQDDAEKAALETLERWQREWQASLAAPPAADAFFHANPARLEALRPAATNPDAARAALAHGFTLADFEILVYLRNPGLGAAEESFRATLERYGQATALNDIQQRYAAFTQGLDTGGDGMAGRTPLAKLFPFPGGMALKGEIAHQEVLAAREKLETTRRQTITAARRAFWELLFARHALALAEQSFSVVDSLKDATAAEYATGRSDIQKFIRVDQQHGIMKERIPVQREMLRTRAAALLALLDLPPDTPVGAPAEEQVMAAAPPPLDRLITLALEKRQELQGMRADIRAAERLIELTETNLYPGVSLNISLPRRNEAMAAAEDGERPESFATTASAVAGAGVPLSPWFGVEDGYLREARGRLRALRRQLVQAEADTRLAVQDAWYRLDKARRETVLYRDKIAPLARTTLDSVTAAQATGKASYADTAGEYNAWFDTSLTLARLQADLGIARAELEDAVGAPIGGKIHAP